MGNTSASLNKIGNQLDTALKSGEAQFSQMTSPANPLECLQSGRRVSLQSKTSGKYLRCLPDGNLDSLGILDGYSNFLVNSVGPNRFTLKNCAYNNYVSLTGGVLACRGDGGSDCEFSASLTTDKCLVVESVANPGHHVGTLNSGEITNPAQTLKEHLAAHFTVLQTNTADTAFKEVASSLQKGVNEAVTSGNQLEALQNGHIVLLESKLSKKCVQIKSDNSIDATGLAEPVSEFSVSVCQSPTEQLYSFSAKARAGVHLSIQAGNLVPGSGPIEAAAQFRAHLVPPNFIALENVGSPGAFIGSLESGVIADPTKTIVDHDAAHFIVKHQKLYV